MVGLGMERRRAAGAALRAGSVACLVALPQVLVGHPGGSAQLSLLVALLAAAFVFSEYLAEAPSLVEFRDARPYNRLRAAALGLTLLGGSALLRPDWAGLAPVAALRRLGELWASLLDLPWSPVHLLGAGLPRGTPPELAGAVATLAATAYGLSLLMVLAFATALRWSRWPGQAAFNMWVNLPQFDPTSGGDVVQRLHQNALVNVALGLMLPLIIPIVASPLEIAFDGPHLRDPAALVWVAAAWALVPASLAMRGLALHRLARLVAAHRARLRRAQPWPLPA